MDPFEGIVVQIVSDGRVLDFYDDPDLPDVDNGRTRQQYVEAVTGSTFCDVDAVLYSINFDGEPQTRRNHSTVKSLRSNWLRNEPAGHTLRTIRYICPRTGEWVRSQYAFGDLKLKESNDMDLSVDQIKNIGRIQVTVQRIKLEKRRKPYVESKYTALTVGEVSEKALKGSAVSNAVSLINTVPSEAPGPHDYRSISIGGEVGEPVVYDILYRSRRALQMIGCIPTSPSATIEIPDDDVVPPENVQQEVQTLRARLAQLERGIGAKAEPRIEVKREGEDLDVGTGSHERPRKMVRVETVDLTDD